MTIPAGALWSGQTLEHYPLRIPRMEAVLGWAQAATLANGQSASIPAKVYIDWWRLYENDTVVYENDFDIVAPFTSGGVYLRNPSWFATDEHQSIQSAATIANSLLTVDVAPWSSNVLHWWQQRKVASQGSYYYIEARVKVEGDVALQFGLDYWLNLTAPYNGYDIHGLTSNNVEAWLSDWIGDTGGQFVTVKWPDRTKKSSIPALTVNSVKIPLNPFPENTTSVVCDGNNYIVTV